MNDLLATCSGGIIFTGDSVLAIREGRKTQTRRVFKPQPVSGFDQTFARCGMLDGYARYKPGKRYYVKETWCHKIDPSSARPIDGEFYYRVDDADLVKVDGDGFIEHRKDGVEASPWVSSMLMPRWAARYVIEIIEVRVQRLQDITEGDARAEGMKASDAALVFQSKERDLGCRINKELSGTCRGAFACAWDLLNGKRSPWLRNPWVAAYTFRLVQP